MDTTILFHFHSFYFIFFLLSLYHSAIPFSLTHSPTPSPLPSILLPFLPPSFLSPSLTHFSPTEPLYVLQLPLTTTSPLLPLLPFSPVRLTVLFVLISLFCLPFPSGLPSPSAFTPPLYSHNLALTSPIHSYSLFLLHCHSTPPSSTTTTTTTLRTAYPLSLSPSSTHKPLNSSWDSWTS